MTIQQFISKYPSYVNEIEKIINPELLNVLENLKSFDIKSHFLCQNLKSITDYEARGLVWTLFLNELRIQSIQKDLLNYID